MKTTNKPMREKLSKRITGISLISAGAAMAAILFAFSIKKPIGDPGTALTLIKSFLTAGTALFGVSIFDTLFKK